MDKGTLVVALYHKDMPPFFFKDENGEMVGVDIDLAKAISKELGVKLVFNRKAKKFDEMVDVVARGEADICISKLSYTESRMKKIFYSEPYLTVHKALLCSRSFLQKINVSGKYNNIYDVFKERAAKIHVLAGSSYVDFAHRLFPDVVIEEHMDSDSLLSVIDKGEGLCCFRDEFEIKKYLLTAASQNPYIFEVVLKDNGDPLHVGINFQYNNLVSFINNIIHSTQTTRDLNMIMDTYKKYYKHRKEKK